MKDKRILYVSSEVVPYLAEMRCVLMSYDVPKMINDQGGQIKIFMPRYGILMRDINYMSRAFRDEFSRE
jgi:starch synthase